MKLRPVTTPVSASSFLSFYPHVTLASSPSDAAALRSAIPADLRTIPIHFRSLEVGAKYFMSVFLAVHSPALETLRGHLRSALGEAAVPALAHMSLYYIDEADLGERERTARRLRSELRVLEAGKGDEGVVQLACYYDEIEGEQDPELIDGFEGEEIWMVRCEGPVEAWEVLEKFPLKRSSE